jgi:amino acid adenylation domain-containing protein
LLFSGLVESASRFPAKVAVEDLGTGASVSYRELEAGARSMAETLKGAGLEHRDPVGLALPGSLGAVVSLLGVLGAGGCYAPAEWDSPVERNIAGFVAAGVRLAVVDAAKLVDFAPWEESGFCPAGRLEIAGGKEAFLLCRPGFQPNPWLRSLDSDPVYILRTSGSTGTPKSVVHTSRSAGYFLDWCGSAFFPNPADRYLSFAEFHFDLSVHDIFLPIRHGARLVLAGPQGKKGLSALGALIAEKGITVVYLTPSILRLLVEYGRLAEADTSALRLALFAGELLPAMAVRRFRELCPGTKVFNLYGPTETNVCFFHEVSDPLEGDDVPIGRPCDGLVAQLRNEEEGAVSMESGMEGELSVSGAALMAGYLGGSGDSGLEADSSGRPWYRTGDWVRVGDNGLCYFLGRKDRLRKRRSYRISLDEIETQLQAHPCLVEAAVVDLGASAVSESVWAFFRSSSEVSEGDLRTHCLRRMPTYMIPDRFLRLPALPRTTTGKMDYRKLEEMAHAMANG